MKRLLSVILVCTMAFALAVPAFADPVNQDFTDTPVDISAPGAIFVGDAAAITVTVENLVKFNRGLPQLSIWIDGECVQSYDEIGKGKTAEYVFDVDTSEAGEQTFYVEVWTRIDNKNFKQLLSEATIVIDVQTKEKMPEEWKADITNAINEAIGTGNITALVEKYGNNGSCIRVTIGGVEYIFTGGNGTNSDKSCSINGIIYTITIQANGAKFTVSGG